MKYTFIFIFLTSLMACSNNHQSPEVVYPESNTDSTNTTQVLEPIGKNLYMDFPFAFDSTGLFIYPVKNTCDLRGSDNYKLRSGLSSSGYEYPERTYRGIDKVSGWFYNFLFREANSETLRPITDKEIRFAEMNIIRDTIQQQAIHTLFFKIYDKDSNQDKFLNRNDLMSYYVTNGNGNNLRKVSPKGHLPKAYQYEKRLKRIYFKTIEDANKNGKFEDNDPRHQYYYSIKTGKVTEVKLPF